MRLMLIHECSGVAIFFEKSEMAMVFVVSAKIDETKD